jgi:hypothetical protein
VSGDPRMLDYEEASAIVTDALADPIVGSEEYQQGWKDARFEAVAALERAELEVG